MKQYLNILQGKNIKEYFTTLDEALPEVITSDNNIRSDYVGTIEFILNEDGTKELSIIDRNEFAKEALERNTIILIDEKKAQIKKLQQELKQLEKEV
jgi:phage anti-repressor protein